MLETQEIQPANSPASTCKHMCSNIMRLDFRPSARGAAHTLYTESQSDTLSPQAWQQQAVTESWIRYVYPAVSEEHTCLLLSTTTAQHHKPTYRKNYQKCQKHPGSKPREFFKTHKTDLCETRSSGLADSLSGSARSLISDIIELCQLIAGSIGKTWLDLPEIRSWQVEAVLRGSGKCTTCAIKWSAAS